MTVLAFPYYGGKSSLLNTIFPLIPQHTHYIEPFGGSAAVLLNKPPSKIETYNDLDSEVVNFFRVLREKEDDLLRLLALTPYSREEFALSKKISTDPIERARRFYIRVRQGFGASPRSNNGWKYNICGRGSHLPITWQNALLELRVVAERLISVQIENLPATEILNRYNSPETFFYCDPPYVLKTRNYKSAYSIELSDAHHCELVEIFKNSKSKILLSGYKNDIYKKLGWERIDVPANPKTAKKSAIESFWFNYDRPLIQMSIFEFAK